MLQAGAERAEGLEAMVQAVASWVEVGGVAILVATAVAATALMFRQWAKDRDFSRAYRSYRQNLGRGILLGLEFLVIADIIGTVAVEPSFRNLGVLALIVLIRTFLSVSLEVEIEGELPWARHRDRGGSAESAGAADAGGRPASRSPESA